MNTITLQAYSDQELDLLARKIQDEKDARWWARVLAVAKQAREIEEVYFQTVADAMLFQCSLSSAPAADEAKDLTPKDKSVREVAYDLAVITYHYEPKEEALALFEKIKCFFNESDFVFGYTHYDVCDNGLYYRMS